MRRLKAFPRAALATSVAKNYTNLYVFHFSSCRQCANQRNTVSSSSQMKGPIPWIVGFLLGIQIGVIGATGIGK